MNSSLPSSITPVALSSTLALNETSLSAQAPSTASVPEPDLPAPVSTFTSQTLATSTVPAAQNDATSAALSSPSSLFSFITSASSVILSDTADLSSIATGPSAVTSLLSSPSQSGVGDSGTPTVSASSSSLFSNGPTQRQDSGVSGTPVSLPASATPSQSLVIPVSSISPSPLSSGSPSSSSPTVLPNSGSSSRFTFSPSSSIGETLETSSPQTTKPGPVPPLGSSSMAVSSTTAVKNVASISDPPKSSTPVSSPVTQQDTAAPGSPSATSRALESSASPEPSAASPSKPAPAPASVTSKPASSSVSPSSQSSPKPSAPAVPSVTPSSAGSHSTVVGSDSPAAPPSSLAPSQTSVIRETSAGGVSSVASSRPTPQPVNNPVVTSSPTAAPVPASSVEVISGVVEPKPSPVDSIAPPARASSTVAPIAVMSASEPSVSLASVSLSIPLSFTDVSKIQSFRNQANVKTPTSTSTVTDAPETTLSKPVLFSITDSLGHLTVTEPPVFTSVGISTLPDGGLVSVTHVIANPTGIWGVSNTSTTKKGFFSNTGAVAGVFLVVGIIAAVIAAFGFFIGCRRRRRNRIRHSISRPLPYPSNPFEDPRESPEMRFAPSDSSHHNLVGAGVGIAPLQPRNLLDDEIEDDPIATTLYSTPRHAIPSRSVESVGIAGVGAGNKSVGRPAYNGPFSQYHSDRPGHQQRPSLQGPFGIAITTEEIQEAVTVPPRAYSRTDSNQSSPSIYPVSLPPVAAEEQKLAHLPPSPLPPTLVADRRRPALSPLQTQIPTVPSPKSPAPVLPPRNPLRTSQYNLDQNIVADTNNGQPQQQPLLIRTTQLSTLDITGLQTYEPLTPPASISSDSHHNTNMSTTTATATTEGVRPPPLGALNPFRDYLQETVPQTASSSSSSSSSTNALPTPEEPVVVRENYYTRRKLHEVRSRTSVEWKR